MDKKYFIADCLKNGTEIKVVARTEISESEYKNMKAWFDFAYFYHVCKSVTVMAMESGSDFLSFSKQIKDSKKSYDDSELDALLTTGNKFLINYLSFIKMFIDVISNSISKKDTMKLAEFQELNRKMYNHFWGYRFLTRLRNYVIHYDIPLSSVSGHATDGIELLCVRNNLLNYGGWSTLKAEIRKLSATFSVQSYIEDSMVALDTLYLKALETVVDDVVAANEKITGFCKKHEISSPVILVIDSIKEKKTHIEKFPLNDMNGYFRDLSRHPSYNIQLDGI